MVQTEELNETKIMVVEPNLSYSNIEIQSTGEEYGIFELTENEIEELSEDESLIVREPYIFNVLLDEAVVQQNISTSWNLKVNEINLTGSDVSVCIIDSGIDSSHSDLADKVLAEHCFCSNSNCCPDGTSEDNNATDDNGHGTHVAGIIAANGEIQGIGLDVNLVIVKAMDSTGSGNEVDLINAIEWCTNNAETYNITAISMSLGADCDTNPSLCYSNVCSGISISLQSKISEAINKNISVIIATGNDGSSRISWPSCLPNVIRVASIDKDDSTISSFSNINSLVKLLGVGKNINSTMPTYSVYLNSQGYSMNYTTLSGTSMSTPMVAGAIAIINQYLRLSGQTKTTSQIETILYNTGKNILDEGVNYSRVDLYSALISIDETPPSINSIYPLNNSIFTNTNQTFNATFYDWQLNNVTFYLYNSTSLVTQNFGDISGNINSTEVNVTNLTIGENYNYFYEIYDNKSNLYSSENYSFSITDFFVSQDSPENGTYTKENETNFSCTSYSFSNLSNVTFSIYNLTDLLFNETRNISGTQNITIFNYSLENEIDYYWNCLSINNNSENYTNQNYSITYDVTFPKINLTSPSSGLSTTTKTQTFSYSVNDTNIDDCILTINNNNYTVFTQTLSDGTYYWNVTCFDKAENSNYSETRNLIIYTETSSSSSSSSGSSGGGSSGVSSSISKNYIITNSALKTGYTKTVKVGDTLKFNISEETHELKINSIGVSQISITIFSTPKNYVLTNGEERYIDLEDNDNYDVKVLLKNITGSYAEIFVQEINITKEQNEEENDPFQETPSTEKTELYASEYNNKNIVYVVIFILIIILVYNLSKKIKNKKSKKKR